MDFNVLKATNLRPVHNHVRPRLRFILFSRENFENSRSSLPQNKFSRQEDLNWRTFAFKLALMSPELSFFQWHRQQTTMLETNKAFSA